MIGINISTDDIKMKMEEIQQQQQKSKVYKDYMLGVNSQRKIEKEFLSSYQMCPSSIRETDIVPQLSNLNTDKMKSEISENFYNSQLMESISCIASAFTIYTGDFSLSGIERIREYLTDLNQIGEKSAYGYAISASLNGNHNNNFFVLKAPKLLLDADELIHENMVAFGALNGLRNLIPNFAYVYGMITCSPPYIDSNKKVLGWCNSEKLPVSYSIYENIYPSESFSSFCKKCDFNTFMENYLQIVLALREAQIQVGFSHNDLHSSNVLIRKYSDTLIQIPYNTSEGKLFLKSNGTIATIIDYGMSHIELEQDDGRIIHFGNVSEGQNQSSYGVYRDKMNPIIDVYKLLCFCLYDMIQGRDNNYKCYEDVKDILYFFNKTEEPYTIIEQQRNLFYGINLDEITENFNIDEYINFLRQYCLDKGYEDPLSYEMYENYKIIECDETCRTFTNLMEEFGVNDLPKPKNFTEFYDAHGSLIYKLDLEENFIYRNKIDKDIEDLNKFFIKNFNNLYDLEIKKINDLTENLDIIIFDFPTNYYDLLNHKYLDLIKLNTSKYVKFFDSYQRLLLKYKIGIYIIKLFKIKKEKYILTYDELENNLIMAKKTKKLLKQIITKNIHFIKNYSGKFIKPYNWYIDTYVTLESYF